MEDHYANERRRYDSDDMSDANLVSTGLPDIQISDEGGDEDNCVTDVSRIARLVWWSRLKVGSQWRTPGNPSGEMTLNGSADLATKKLPSCISPMGIRHLLNGITRLRLFWLTFLVMKLPCGRHLKPRDRKFRDLLCESAGDGRILLKERLLAFC